MGAEPIAGCCRGCENKIINHSCENKNATEASPCLARSRSCARRNLSASWAALLASRIACCWIRLIFIRYNYAGARFSECKSKQCNFNKSINTYDSSSVIFGKSSDGLKLNELTSFLSAVVLCWDEQKLMKSRYNSKINIIQ